MHIDTLTVQRENELLRQQLLQITETMTTSHQQISYLDSKHQRRESRLLEKLENLEQMSNDMDIPPISTMENVTIFKRLETPPRPRSKSKGKSKGNGRSVSSRCNKRNTNPTISKTVRTMKRSNSYHEKRDGSARKVSAKKVITRSRSVRHSKSRTPKVQKVGSQGTEGMKGRLRRKSTTSATRANTVESEMVKKCNVERASSVSQSFEGSQGRKKRKSLSAIRKPSASIRRLSVYSNTNMAS